MKSGTHYKIDFKNRYVDAIKYVSMGYWSGYSGYSNVQNHPTLSYLQVVIQRHAELMVQTSLGCEILGGA
jgi:hypothetical protein